jgi:hypothetical protein
MVKSTVNHSKRDNNISIACWRKPLHFAGNKHANVLLVLQRGEIRQQTTAQAPSEMCGPILSKTAAKSPPRRIDSHPADQEIPCLVQYGSTATVKTAPTRHLMQYATNQLTPVHTAINIPHECAEDGPVLV